MKKIIGIKGKKGHGKDSLVEAIQRASDLPVRRLAFADPIKEMLHVGLGIPREILWGPAHIKERVDPRFGVTYRHMAQTLGTEWGRMLIAEDIWIKLALENHVPTVESFLGPILWVISDVRFINEARVIKENGGFIVEIERPGHSTGEEGESHASETEMDQIKPDLYVINNGTLDDLEAAGEWVMDRIEFGLDDSRSFATGVRGKK